MLTLSRVALSLLFCLGTGAATALPVDFIFASGEIDVNTASYEELQKIKGVGPVIANRIMEMRQNCYFYPLSSLTEVKGIGETILKKIEDEGKAFVQLPPSAGDVILCQNSKEIEKGLDYSQAGPAALSETVKGPDSIEEDESAKRPSVPFSAIALAIFSGTIILILKKKLRNLPTTD
ncbi:MAG: helix-hairpin-helix domain-containing protein [bacterium]|nr:helix-hairpin-helix domain-containing protein [bacterium]